MTRIMLLKQFLLAVLVSLVFACGNTVDDFYKEVNKYGYINYTTPLDHAGTGTLVGGEPDSLAIIAHPHSCFPPMVGEEETGLRMKDTSTLPQTEASVMISGGAQADLFKVLRTGSPSIGAKAAIATVDKIKLEFKGISIEYMDSIKLARFYRQYMSDICKDYLDKVGFIIQAIRVDQMQVSFYKLNDVLLELSIFKIKNLLDLSPQVKWSIMNKSTLVIETPKYIGYQLGRLKREDNGIALYRATEIRGNRFIFKNLKVFDKSFIDEGSWEEGGKMKDNREKFYVPLLGLEEIPVEIQR